MQCSHSYTSYDKKILNALHWGKKEVKCESKVKMLKCTFTEKLLFQSKTYKMHLKKKKVQIWDMN